MGDRFPRLAIDFYLPHDDSYHYIYDLYKDKWSPVRGEIPDFTSD